MVPVGPAPPEMVPEPDAAGTVVLPGIGNGGATVDVLAGEEVTLADVEAFEEEVTLADAEVSVAGALVVLPKLAGRVMPLSVAQVLGSTPLGQQSPLVKQKEPVGQGSVKQNNQYRWFIRISKFNRFSQPSEQHESPMVGS